MTPLLPGLFAEFSFPGDTDDRLKHDFSTTVTDLLIDNHLKPLATWASEKGLTFRGQSYGFLGVRDNARLAAAVPKPDVETMGFGDPNIRAYVPGGSGPLPPGTAQDAFRKAMSQQALTWDAVTPANLLATGPVKGGRLLPDGPAYEAAVIMFDRRATSRPSVVSTNAEQVVQTKGRLVARDHDGGERWFQMSDGTKRVVEMPNVPAALSLTGPWTLEALTVSPRGDATVTLEFDTHTDWSQIPELKGKSGTGIYTRTLQVPKSWLGRNHGVEIETGNFDGAVRMWLNDRQVPVATVPNRPFVDVTGLLRPGTNEIKIELSPT